MTTTDQSGQHDGPDAVTDELVGLYLEKDEAIRLGDGEGRVEFLRTQQLLREVLPAAPARILDVGGAEGIHSAWLLDDGHRVEIIDLVPHHVDRAQARGFAARAGDARHLDVPSDSVEVVLLLGPLFHLLDRKDRITAIQEARRVLRPGGVLAAAAVTRMAVALGWLRAGLLGTDHALQVVSRIVAAGMDDTVPDKAVCYFHTADELREELADCGFDDAAVHGVEGPAWLALDAHTPPDDPLIGEVLHIAHPADADPSTVGASAHLLALARK